MKSRSSRSRLLSDATSPNTAPGLGTGLKAVQDAGVIESDSDGEADGGQMDALTNASDDRPSDDSSYPEVRAAVLSTDNVYLSVSTPRMWTLSLLFAIFGSSTNLFFSLRYPSVAITPVIALILAHPLGKAWDLLLKRPGDREQSYLYGKKVASSFSNPFPERPRSKRDSLRLWLSQGRWNEKEHACVFVSSNVSFGFAFATDVIVEQHKFYKQDVPILYQIFLTTSSQILGYAFAGIGRRFLVRPPSMIWPGVLASTAMFTTLHQQVNVPANGWKVSRLRFFVVVWVAGFAWYFLPGLLIPALGAFNLVTWFAPDNVIIANLFGVKSGLGLFPLTFDWAYIAYIGSPLLTPWWAAANVLVGVFVIMWLLAPLLYYNNVLYSAYMPLLSSSVFDNTGGVYNVTKVLDAKFQFDVQAYEKYSPIYLPVTYALSYALQFAGLAALISHTWCWYGRDILQQTKDSFALHDSDGSAYQRIDQDSLSHELDESPTSPTLSSSRPRKRAVGDVHSRLMEGYSDAPIRWYLICFASMLVIATFTVEIYPTNLPWYGVLLALIITAIMFIPTAIVMAVANQHISLYLISQIVCGVVFPGRPIANMIFVTYCYISSAQGIKFTSDLKLGHYMKLPPRLLFKVQIVATLMSSLTQLGVLNWMFANIPDLCQADAANGFTCPFARVHFNGSILWGVVGPDKFFGPEALYRHLIWAFPLGFLAPVGLWHLSNRKPSNKLWKNINLPVMFGTLSWIPPATGLNFSVWALVCYVFNHVLRQRARPWWRKYTMVLSAALDFGLGCGVIVVFFVFLFPGYMDGFKWWGTEIFKQVSQV